ncbi:MAG: enoyl-CoA hydratase/isomerase family protein [Nitrospirae bacterium]|nr:enoyl-CoA hydratase/isomerase family protein [Nitrospirota bacterium]
MSKTTDAVLLTTDGAVATLTLNRPDRMNSIDVATLDLLCERLREAGRCGVRVLVVTGAGNLFSAGADGSEMVPRSSREWEALVDHYLDPIRLISELPIPVVARINGDCVGGAMGIALSCDFRIAVGTARFAAPFVKIGLAGCDMSCGYFLPRIIGLGRATDLMMTGRYVDAPEAERIGLIHRAVEPRELDAVTDELVKKLASGPPIALNFTKKAIRRSLDRNMAAEFDYEILAQVQCLQTDDHREGVRAFFKEKRAPKYVGT